MLDTKGIDLKDKVVVVSGSGNVATYAIEKAQEFGAKVVTCSDSNGYVYDPAGIDLAASARSSRCAAAASRSTSSDIRRPSGLPRRLDGRVRHRAAVCNAGRD